MHKNILICVGITILFLGLAIQPSIAVNPISADNEDDCSICPKVSSLHLVGLKDLINRVETLNNKLSVGVKHNPDVAEKYQELSEGITTLTKMSKESKPDKDYPIICDILLMVFITSGLKAAFIEFFAEIVYPILGNITNLVILNFFYDINFLKAFAIIFFIAPYLGCIPWPDFPEESNI